ncbi:MAG: hypothetical protein ACO1SX_25640, partial [Actinomycetota bacterium]
VGGNKHVREVDGMNSATTTPRLNPTEQRIVDALAARGLTLRTTLRKSLVNSLAAELGWPAATVRSERDSARKQCGLSLPHRATGKPRGRPRKTESPDPRATGLLPEAPTLPLGCADPHVVARCQREGRRLAETAVGRWRGWRGW